MMSHEVTATSPMSRSLKPPGRRLGSRSITARPRRRWGTFLITDPAHSTRPSSSKGSRRSSWVTIIPRSNFPADRCKEVPPEANGRQITADSAMASP